MTKLHHKKTSNTSPDGLEPKYYSILFYSILFYSILFYSILYQLGNKIKLKIWGGEAGMNVF
jgi:hypothetical protein